MTTLLRADRDPESGVLGRDKRVLVRDTRVAPFRYICHLSYAPPGGGRWTGSGTLIGPQTVLTSAHNLFGKVARYMRVSPGLNGTVTPYGSALAQSFSYWSSGYSQVNKGTAHDLALIHLAAPLTLATTWTRHPTRASTDRAGRSILNDTSPLSAGALKVNLSGYPADKCATPSQAISCGSTQWRIYNATVKVASGMLHYLNDIQPGHSGGPVWVRRHSSMGGRVLVAVHVGSNQPRGRKTSNKSVLLTPDIVKWITSQTR